MRAAELVPNVVDSDHRTPPFIGQLHKQVIRADRMQKGLLEEMIASDMDVSRKAEYSCCCLLDAAIFPRVTSTGVLSDEMPVRASHSSHK